MSISVNPQNLENIHSEIIIMPIKNGYGRFDVNTGQITQIGKIKNSEKSANDYSNPHNHRLSNILDKTGKTFKNIGGKAKTIGEVMALTNPELEEIALPLIFLGEGLKVTGRVTRRTSKVTKKGKIDRKDVDKYLQNFGEAEIIYGKKTKSKKK